MSGGAPRAAVLGLLALVLALAVAGPAAAKGSRALGFETHGSHGYRLIVRANAASVSLSATRVGTHAETGSLSSYIARRKSGPGAIHATFGGLGSISMRFRPRGPATETPPRRNCIGPDHYTIQPGLFVGRFRFSGEGGYTTVDAGRVTGSETSPKSLLCGLSSRTASASATKKAPPPTYFFQAHFRKGLLEQTFSARADRGGPGEFQAIVRQTQGSLAIERIAVAKGPPRTFASDDALSFATIEPTAPFSGTGSLTRDPGGLRQWGGTLSVNFPGAPHVPLTGPSFKTRLSRSF